MGVRVRIEGPEARFDAGTWESNVESLRVILQQATDIRGYESLPWDPAGVEHVRGILADYGGEIVEVEPIDEADAVPGRIY